MKIWVFWGVLGTFFLIQTVQVGCSGKSRYLHVDTRTMDMEISRIEQDSSIRTLEAEYQRLAADMVWAVEKVHWAVLNSQRMIRIDDQQNSENAEKTPDEIQADIETDGKLVKDNSGDQQINRLHRINALLPDGRQAVIYGWVENDGKLAAAVKVGHFGDNDKESQYLDMLAKLMAGKPRPTRGGKFDLPELPDLKKWLPLKKKSQDDSQK